MAVLLYGGGVPIAPGEVDEASRHPVVVLQESQEEAVSEPLGPRLAQQDLSRGSLLVPVVPTVGLGEQ